MKKLLVLLTFLGAYQTINTNTLKFPIYKHPGSPQYIGNYIASNNPLPLGDKIDPSTGTLERGYIMNLLALKATDQAVSLQTIKGGNIAEKQQPLFNMPQYVQDIFNFDSTLFRLEVVAEQTKKTIPDLFVSKEYPGLRVFKCSGLNTYQYIIDQIAAAPAGNQNAVKALAGFETLLWQLYEYYAYYISIPTHRYLKPITPIKGIRGPTSWLSDSDELKQIIDEVEKLAKIAEKHSLGIAGSFGFNLANRMEATVHSYRHWRTYGLGLGLAAGAGIGGAAAAGKVSLAGAKAYVPSMSIPSMSMPSLALPSVSSLLPVQSK